MDHLFRIGQISNLYGISIDTLRHYDRKGLLKPVVDPESGYRYYTFEHLDILEMILVGKYLEIPLDQMKVQMEEESIEGYLFMMEEQSHYIEERLLMLKKLGQYTREMTSLLKEIQGFTNDDTFSKVIVKEKEDITIYHVDLNEILSGKESSQVKGFEAFEQWFGYEMDEEGNLMEDDQTIGLSLHSDMLSKKQLNTIFQGAKKSRIQGKYRHISFWGSEIELKDYIQRFSLHFHLEKQTFYVKFRFALVHKEKPNEYYAEIYFT
jgi:DNA-binding transcriptional MerR regulator